LGKADSMEKPFFTAIAEFFEKERGKMKNFIKSKLSDSSSRDAEDIIQDVMLKLFENADINIPLEKLSSYIYTSIRNRIIDLYRSKKPQISIEELGQEEEFSLAKAVNDGRMADVEMEKKEYFMELCRALDLLDADEREVVIATEFDDYTFKELSEEWCEPIGTLLSRKTRAIQKIRSILLKGGVKDANKGK
jgi:RNA polymerase sigma factor (sigma-70 family)